MDRRDAVITPSARSHTGTTSYSIRGLRALPYAVRSRAPGRPAGYPQNQRRSRESSWDLHQLDSIVGRRPAMAAVSPAECDRTLEHQVTLQYTVKYPGTQKGNFVSFMVPCLPESRAIVPWKHMAVEFQSLDRVRPVGQMPRARSAERGALLQPRDSTVGSNVSSQGSVLNARDQVRRRLFEATVLWHALPRYGAVHGSTMYYCSLQGRVWLTYPILLPHLAKHGPRWTIAGHEPACGLSATPWLAGRALAEGHFCSRQGLVDGLGMAPRYKLPLASEPISSSRVQWHYKPLDGEIC
ncbi:hypothetical protein JX265_005575 [Neoarthrinium moseri]|uniref:Uncharacterized protein n=1 Tax=Neoarthrinium moseri TaxID=1658444 RepID=A0A9P9WNY6_9PEZI|nr:uncharacterized protein JN550_010300 [Neoarthrinium moseri]KAI1847366.1 hypothetical protein JX266_006591 [Neoarthrinium moseri]KAI1862293.1 hypothetical protein JN550_010300 [Neoarthrinium moseri]KAI1872695.1 hypothetical protein JX265_005575 [Neoarthrinium moseri]